MKTMRLSFFVFPLLAGALAGCGFQPHKTNYAELLSPGVAVEAVDEYLDFARELEANLRRYGIRRSPHDAPGWRLYVENVREDKTSLSVGVSSNTDVEFVLKMETAIRLFRPQQKEAQRFVIPVRRHFRQSLDGLSDTTELENFHRKGMRRDTADILAHRIGALLEKNGD